MHSVLPGNVRQLQSICHWLTVMSSSKTISLADLPRDLDQIMPIHKDVGVVNQNVAPTQTIHQDLAPSSISHQPFVQAISSGWEQILGLQAKKMLEDGKTDVFKELQDKFERAVIQAALDMTRGRKVEAAERLGIGRNTITRKLQELDIQD
jgi:two-component system nitrogen regulation response regulator GlnG